MLPYRLLSKSKLLICFYSLTIVALLNGFAARGSFAQETMPAIPSAHLYLPLVTNSIAATGSFAQETIPAIPGAYLYLPLVTNAMPGNTPGSTTTNPPVPPPAAALPKTVVIKSSRGLAAATAYRIVGEIQNTATDPVYAVYVQARFFTTDNQPVAVEGAYTVFDMTLPGQVNPFEIFFENAPDSIDHYELSLTYEDTGFLAYQTINVLSQQARSDPSVEIFGEIRNETETLVRPLSIAVTFYDESGNVVDLGSTLTDGDLASQQTTPYAIKTFRTINYANYSVQAQSYPTP
ncbi:hypothetical protein BH10CHL1_BH10CHL1_27010 [soil metagenome]